MDRFEQGFSNTERSAGLTHESASALVKTIKQLQKAAKEGNITNLKKSQQKLAEQMSELQQAVMNARDSWPFEESDEEQYLSDGFASELQRAGTERELQIYERDGRLIAHPAIVRILSAERAVRVDRRKVSTIRPSYLVDLLIKNQQKPGRFPAGRFLEALHGVYLELIKQDSADKKFKFEAGPVVQLTRIYKLFTSLPGSSLEYSKADFSRELYLLETSGLTTTKSGVSFSFHASSGTRSSKGQLTFVGPDGRDVQYYGIQFTSNN